MNWRSKGVLTLLGSLLTAAMAAADVPARPNFVFIISDDQRWDTLGAAGNRAIRTPVLDKLAVEGVWFRQATIHVPQCSPTRCNLLTGLPPHQNGWYSNQYQRADVVHPDGLKNVPTLPGLLQQAGYRTVLVGKWHLRPEPWNCGFSDVRIWMPGGGGPYTKPRLAQGESRELRPYQGFTQQIFADDAIAFLKSAAATEQPFFLWLAFTAPHSPFAPNPESIERLYARQTAAELLPPGFPQDVTQGPWKIYYEAISFLDEQVGRLLHTLQERQLADRTVVVFLSDNGFMMHDRGWNGKVVPYEGSVRVPLLMRVPGLTKLRGAHDAPVSSHDLPPTFLRLAGVTPPVTWSGRDLTPLLRGAANHGITEAICEWADNQSKEFGALSYRLVRTPTHKLIVWEKADKPDELYDLVADARESHNRINDQAHARVRDELRQRLRVWMEKTDDPARQWKKE